MTDIAYSYSILKGIYQRTDIIPIINQTVYHKRINAFIDEWNKTPRKIFPSDGMTFRLVYHDGRDLYSGNECPFGQDEYKLMLDTPVGKLPTIHLTLFDIFEENEIINQEIENGIPPVLRYKKIIDSSIWNHYVPIVITRSNIDFTRFNSALKDIDFHYRQGHYHLNVAREYVDLNARLVEQSHLNGSHKAISPFLFHSESEMKKKIHNLKIKEKNGEESLVLDVIKRYKWRFLLLDDKSISRMSVINNQKVEICKLQIIYDNLHRVLDFRRGGILFRTFDFQPIRDINDGRIINEESHIIIEKGKNNKRAKSIEPVIKCERVEKTRWNAHKFEINNSVDSDSFKDTQLIIDCVNHVDEAEYCLQKYRYDIILIDYLLDKDKIKGEHKQEYGYYLLNNLQVWYGNHQKETTKDKDRALYNIGPNNILTMMFISAFTTAMRERVLELGLERTEIGLWHIGNSACPTNTPYLFSYLLLQLMKYRINNLRNDNEGEQLTIIDLLEKIYVKEGDFAIERVRKEANRHFNHLLFMRAKYKRLRNDLEEKEEKDLREHSNETEYVVKYLTNMKSSLLIYSAFKVIHYFSEVFFDHLQHLVYLTAFGTIRQWQDMWEEYEFVYRELYEYDNYVVDNEGKKQNRGKKICNAIKEYIINLKENSI